MSSSIVGFRVTKTMRSNFSDQQIAELRESFALFDHDGDGSISDSELRAAMQSLGYNPSDTQIHNMISGYDVDGNGRIDFDEYLTMMRSKMGGPPIDGEEEMRQAFRVLDADGNGYISAEELHRVMHNVLRDEHLTDSQISAMVRQADLDGDGRINYDDFCNFARPIFVGISKSSSLHSRESRQSCSNARRTPSLPEVD